MDLTIKYHRFLMGVFCFFGVIAFISCPLFESPDSIIIPPPEAEIEVSIGGTGIFSGGSFDIGNICINTSFDVTIAIWNIGSETLNLTGIHDKVVKSGPDASLFTIISQPASPLSPGSSTQFSIRFSTDSSGQKTTTLSIDNDDPDENPFTFETTATGIVPPGEIPATGQTTSYASGDDGDLEIGVNWSVSRFSYNDYTVTDSLTGLMWQKTPSGAYASWSSRIYYANDLNLDSFDDWRLPNVLELQSLVNTEESYPATWLNNQGFTGILSNDYWTSTQSESDMIYAWEVRFDDGGHVARSGKTDWGYGLAVRNGQAGVISLPKTGQTSSGTTGSDGNLELGESWPFPRFLQSGNDIVTDNLTGLVWEKVPTGTTLTWVDALTYANNLTLSDYSDWRLPNRNELRSLINYGSSNSANWLNWKGFENVQANAYWSSSTYAPDTDSAWIVVMELGHVVYDEKTKNYYVWAVRGGE